MQTALAWQSLLIMFIWVPFAVAGGLLATWRTPGGRAFRADAAHPLRAYRRRHPLAFKHARA